MQPSPRRHHAAPTPPSLQHSQCWRRRGRAASLAAATAEAAAALKAEEMLDLPKEAADQCPARQDLQRPDIFQTRKRNISGRCRGGAYRPSSDGDADRTSACESRTSSPVWPSADAATAGARNLVPTPRESTSSAGGVTGSSSESGGSAATSSTKQANCRNRRQHNTLQRLSSLMRVS